MKYYGWSWADIQTLPVGYYPVAVDIINEEAQRIEEASRGR
jgi:hypothetical protein